MFYFPDDLSFLKAVFIICSGVTGGKSPEHTTEFTDYCFASLIIVCNIVEHMTRDETTIDLMSRAGDGQILFKYIQSLGNDLWCEGIHFPWNLLSYVSDLSLVNGI